MNHNKRIVTLLLISIIILPIFSSISNAINIESDLNLNELPESHLIEDVPYVFQEGGFFCSFASETMILKYLGINTSLREVLYLKGTGHSLIYPDFYYNSALQPTSPALICQQLEDTNFICDMYGISYSYWPDENFTGYYEGMWDEYLIRVKQNLSNNIPISTGVHVGTLPKFRDSYKLPDFLMDLFHVPGGHVIVLVGYNESNNTVCYHDPGDFYYEEENSCEFIWIDLDDFKKAALAHVCGYPWIYKYEIISEPLEKSEIFEKAYHRNIECLKGNTSAYDENLVDYLKNESYYYGINATKKLKESYSPGLNNRITTIKKLMREGRLGIKYTLSDVLKTIKLFPKSWRNTMFGMSEQTQFVYTYDSRKFAADFLRENPDLSPVCKFEAPLLEQEAENWTKLNDYFVMFMKRGIFMPKLRALYLITKMEETMANIISIEEAIIAGPN